VTGLYLAAIMLAAAGVLVLDRRYGLFVWRSPAKAAVVVAVGTAALLVCDLIAIRAGVFLVGDSPHLTGVMLAEHLPLEEPLFLAFLSLVTMVLVGAAERWGERS